MRFPASEKLEIIRLVEQSHLPIRQTLDKLGIPRTTFYRWYDRYQIGGPQALEDQSPRPSRIWNRIPDDVRQSIVDLALDVPELSPRELAVRFTDTEKYFGGVRWWFVCPVTGAKAAKLYLPPGCDTFASRKAFHLAYRSQNEMPRDRLLTKVQDIRRKLGGRASLLEPFPDKPKGMHWQMYWRLRATSERAEQASLMALSQRFGLVV